MTEQKQLTGNEIRQMFLDFFQSKGCMVEPGASLIPHNDPTLLWINAGVAALKKYFDGREKPRCNRICNAQKSIRTNDIENVGNAIIRSSKCWATSPSETISRRKPFPGHGNSSQARNGSDSIRKSSMSPSTRMMMKPTISG